MATSRRPPTLASVEKALAAQCLSYPETREDNPWGERAFKVKGKVFLFLHHGDELSCSLKLPRSAGVALDHPAASPTRYGLGPKGWVTFRFAKGDPVPLDALLAWLDESFRAVAPAKLVRALP